MSVSVSGTARPLGVGDVIRTAIEAARRNIKALALLALLWVALPEAVRSLLTMNAETQSMGSVFSILGIIFTGAAARLIISDLQGHPVAFKDAQQAAIKLFLPVFGIGLLAGLGVVLGMLLLIVPGVILALMWSVAVPVRVAEGPGVRAALHRSRVLTAGYRWPIFLVLLVTIIPAMILIVAALLIAMPFGAEGPIALVVVTPLMVAATSVIFGVVPPTLYMRLRDIKEGGGPVRLAEVFD